MLPVLRLIRPLNLGIIVLSMYLVRHCLILPVFRYSTIVNPQLRVEDMLRLSEIQFAFLVLASVLIAAAGNVINDYFDQDVDAVNKPQKQVVGTALTEQGALRLYWILTGTALLLSLWLAWTTSLQMILFINVLAMGLLWFYSEKLKRWFLAGNLVVAFLSALVLLLPGLSEPEFYPNMRFCFVYAGFAFLLTLIREIAKDVEDIEGDRAAGCKTFAIVAGTNAAKWLAIGLTLLLTAFLAWVLHKNFFENTVTSFGNIITVAMIPCVILLYLLVNAQSRSGFRSVSSFTKVFMILGVLSMMPLYLLFLKY